MPNIDRRKFLNYSARLTGGTVAGLVALQNNILTGCAPEEGRSLRDSAGIGDGGYGPLRPAGPDLALPEGFEYRTIGIEGSVMSDGNETPAQHDGMAAFPMPNGNVRLVRNHEVTRQPTPRGAFGDVSLAYDSTSGGGTTSLEVDPVSRELVRDFASLSGTYANCAGGPTPWGSWLTCEETTVGRDRGYLMPHGYIFDVPADSETQVEAVPLPAMGRFMHEATAVDPSTGIIYETEDSGARPLKCGFYRFLPEAPYGGRGTRDLTQGGLLQMLAVRDQPNVNLTRGQHPGRSMAVDWVDIPDPDTAEAEANELAVFEQGWNAGGARFDRLEGCWWGEGQVYFSSTNGGDAQQGQIWRYVPDDSGGVLTLVYESPDAEIMNLPDNVCLSPRGGLVICEDGSDGNFIRGLTQDGRLFTLVENIYNEREFAGTTFSPDGNTLFLNIQSGRGGNLGKTYAVWGPWERGSL